MSNEGLRDIIFDIKRITTADVSIWKVSGELLLSTSDLEDDLRESLKDSIIKKVTPGTTPDGIGIFPIIIKEETAAYLVIDEQELTPMAIALCISQVENFYKLCDESMDQDMFIKKLMQHDVSASEIEISARKLGMNPELDRVVYVLSCEGEMGTTVMSLIGQLYEVGPNDFVIEMEPGKIIFVKGLDEWTQESVNVGGYTLVDTIEAELMTKVRVSYGEVSQNLQGLKQAYRQANTAMEVGYTFYQDRKVISYNELGVGRLVHGLPQTLSEEFLNEVLNGNAIEQFDEEIMGAVHKFFYNNLNISETARQLYVHRNTLVYRLGKVEKKTGLDIRLFEDALTFKMALMVSEQLKV